MDVSEDKAKASNASTEPPAAEATRLLLERRQAPGESTRPASSSPTSTLYPPGYAGVNRMHGDISADELSKCEEWVEDISEVLEEATSG